MNRLPVVLPALLLLPILGACAGGTSKVDVAPVSDLPAEMPVAWFADQWGPFEAEWTEPEAYDGRGRPLLILDGVQLHPAEWIERMAAMGPRPMDSENFLAIRVFKNLCDTRHFGRAADRGIVMVFTTEYRGPLPGFGTPYSTRCDARGP